jgi:hypothetical protein
MTRYFFDIQSGREFFLDEEGLELPNHKAAEIEAMQTLIGMARDSVFTNGPIWRSRFAPPPSDCFALP